MLHSFKALCFYYIYKYYNTIPLNYVSDSAGVTIAVQISINDWKKIKNKYPDVNDINNDIPQWQKDMIDRRWIAIQQDPDSIKDIEGLFEEFDKEIE
jgi:hypothetical protein